MSWKVRLFSCVIVLLLMLEKPKMKPSRNVDEWRNPTDSELGTVTAVATTSVSVAVMLAIGAVVGVAQTSGAAKCALYGIVVVALAASIPGLLALGDTEVMRRVASPRRHQKGLARGDYRILDGGGWKERSTRAERWAYVSLASVVISLIGIVIALICFSLTDLF